MTKFDELYNRMSAIGTDAVDWMSIQLKKRDISSININPYIMEGYVTNYPFYYRDKNCYCVSLFLEKLIFENDEISLIMYDTDEKDYTTLSIDNLNDTEKLYVLSILEEIFDYVDNDGTPLLKKDETFEDYEK